MNLSSLRRVFFAVVLTSVTSVAVMTEVAMAKDANLNAYRTTVLAGLKGHVDAVASIVDGKVQFWHHVPDHAVGIVGSTRGLLEIFPAKPGSSGNGAKEPAQRTPSKFELAATQLNVEATRLVQAADTGDKNAITAQFKLVRQSYDAFTKAADDVVGANDAKPEPTKATEKK